MRANGASAAPAVAGALTVGAGLVHATAAGSHGGDEVLVALMALTAVAQVGLGIAATMRPDRLMLGALLGLNVLVSAGWLLSRTVGLPMIAGLAEAEAVGVPDALATVMQVGAVVAAVVAIARADAVSRPAVTPLCSLVFLPVLIGMTAPHTHAGGHGHDAVHEEAAGHEHAVGDEHAPPEAGE